MKIPRFLISAPSSGCGKSTIVSGLMAAFSQTKTVQGFKVGPDFVDPMYHRAATGRPSINIDSWMLSPEINLTNFQSSCSGADLAIVEGVMGLFDGYGSDPFTGSTAATAKLLSVPVILVLDSSKLSGTGAAIVKGLSNFDPDLQLAGVICNKVGSKRHGEMLRESIENYAQVPVLGCLPKLAELQIPERQLGLHPVGEHPQQAQIFISQAREFVQKYLDLAQILSIAENASELPSSDTCLTGQRGEPVRIGVAQDEAFCFYYQDNLNALQSEGAILVPFSPLKDSVLPNDLQGLYFGGGYTELYAETLSKNITLLAQVQRWCEENKPIYAEGAAFVYLSEGYKQEEGFFPLVGAVPGYCEPSARLCMGYRLLEPARDNLLSLAGTQLRGHEFHYSQWKRPSEWSFAYYTNHKGAKREAHLEGCAKGNLLASFIHLSFLQNPDISKSFIKKCHLIKEIKQNV